MKIAPLILAALLTPSAARAEPQDRDPDTGLRLSIIGTAAPAALIGVGALIASGTHGDTQNAALGVMAGGAIAGIVTPALGEAYGGRWFTGGMGLRAAGFVTANIGLFLAYNNAIGDCVSSCHVEGRSVALIAAGAAMYLGGTYLDVADARGAARSWNAAHHLQVTPTAVRTNGAVAPGVAVALSF